MAGEERRGKKRRGEKIDIEEDRRGEERQVERKHSQDTRRKDKNSTISTQCGRLSISMYKKMK